MDEARSLLQSLSKRQWFWLEPNGKTGSVPRFRSSKLLPIPTHGDIEYGPALILGPCRIPGTLYATTRVAQLAKEPLPKSEARSLALSIPELPREFPGTEIRATRLRDGVDVNEIQANYPDREEDAGDALYSQHPYDQFPRINRKTVPSLKY